MASDRLTAEQIREMHATAYRPDALYLQAAHDAEVLRRFAVWMDDEERVANNSSLFLASEIRVVRRVLERLMAEVPYE